MELLLNFQKQLYEIYWQAVGSVSTLFTLLSVAWYVFYQAITFDLGDLSFTEAEVEQLNQDFKGGLRNVRRNN